MSEPPRLRVVAAVVFDGDRILMTQRPPGGSHALLWEFPGGKIEPGETPGQALIREVHEELGVAARPIETMAVEHFDYHDGPRVELHFVRAALGGDAFTASAAVHDVRWLRPADVRLDDVLEADRAFVRRLGAPKGDG